MHGIMNIGRNSMMAYQNAMSVTSNNMANIATAFYSRREPVLNDSLLGGGVSLANVQRVWDQAASQNVQQKQSAYSQMNMYLERLSDFESMLGDESVIPFINDSLAALRSLNSSAADQGKRQLFMDKLSSLAQQFQSLNLQMQTEQTNTNQSIIDNIDEINQLTQQIASINQQITGSPGLDPSDLLDLREQTIQKLAGYLNFTTLTDAQGNLNIYLGNGASLVTGNISFNLSTQPDPANAQNLDIIFNGNDVTKSITGGSLAGLINYGSSITQSSIALGRLSLAIADMFNYQNSLGVDLNGNVGGNIFNDINTATAMSSRVIANANNGGSANMGVQITDVKKLTTSNYQLTFDASNNYVLTRLSDNSVVSSGSASSLPLAISVDGFTLNINSGSFSAGDQYIISPTANAAASMKMALTDYHLLALAFPITATANTANTGKGTIQINEITDTATSAFSIPKQLNPPINIVFLSPTSYQIVNANDSTIIEGPITYNPETGATIFPTPGGYDPGFRISLSGTINAGDTFNINYNTTNFNDNGNGLALAKLYDQGVLENGKLKFSQGYDALTHDVAIEVNTAQAGCDASESALQSAMKFFSDISGVDAFEEQANLLSLQTGFQASAQILDAAKSIFDVIIGIAR